MPPKPTSDLECRSLVPTELALNRSDVVESGLDLDDKDGFARRIVGEDVDPAMRSPLDHLDLPRSRPSADAESAINVPRTPGVDEVALARASENDRLSGHQVEVEAQRMADLLDDDQRWIRPATLDRGDVGAR